MDTHTYGIRSFSLRFFASSKHSKKNRINITTFESKFHFLFHFFDPNVKHHSSHSHSQTDTLTLCLIKFRNLFIHSFIWPIILWMSLIMEQINRNWMRQNERMREKSLMTENMERNYSSRIKNLWCSFQWMDGWINHKKEKKNHWSIMYARVEKKNRQKLQIHSNIIYDHDDHHHHDSFTFNYPDSFNSH